MKQLLASELRIKNWINYINTPVRCSLDTIHAVSKIVPPSVMYTPIPITEQWLLDFGFEKDYYYVSEENPFIDWIKDGVRLNEPYFEFSYNDGENNIEIKHIHTLQNIYHSLTGQELTKK